MKLCHAWKIVALFCALVPAGALGGKPPAITVAQNDATRAVARKTDDPKLELPPLKKLTVRVLDRDGNAVVGAHVGLGAHFGRKMNQRNRTGLMPTDSSTNGIV